MQQIPTENIRIGGSVRTENGEKRENGVEILAQAFWLRSRLYQSLQRDQSLVLETLIQSKPTPSLGERLQSSDLLLLNLLHELRREYPVRQIADTALLGMIMSLISRAVIDQAAFGAISLETRVQQIIEVCVNILFTEPVPLPV